MQKDFKIGLIFGLFVVVLILIWLAAQPSSSLLARLSRLQQNSRQTEDTAANVQKSRPQSGSVSPAVPSSVIVEEASASQSAEPQGQRFHIVMPNQTLSDIARIYYGSGLRWTKIRDANPSINPDKLSPGTRLYIPP